MLIAIFGESCTGKSTLAEKIADSLSCEIITGKDYLRLAKNENIAKMLFQKKLQAAVTGEKCGQIAAHALSKPGLDQFQVCSNQDPQCPLRQQRQMFLFRDYINDVLAVMLEKKHGCFDDVPHDFYVVSGETDLDLIVEEVMRKCT